MPFGLTNSLTCFQRELDITLTKYKRNACAVYLGNVIIVSNNVDDHIKHVDDILKPLTDAVLTLKIIKCYFFQRYVEYLDHMVNLWSL